jgi:hypothetical protein
MGGPTLTSKRRHKWKVLAGVVPVSVLTVFLFPEIFSLGWHIAYGRSVVFHELRIPVPFMWFASLKNDQLAIAKLPRFYSSKVSAGIVVSPPGSAVLAGSQSIREAVEAASLKETYEKKGYRELERYKQSVGKSEATCMEFESLRFDGEVAVVCTLLGQKARIYFTGPKSELPVFRSILARTVESN